VEEEERGERREEQRDGEEEEEKEKTIEQFDPRWVLSLSLSLSAARRNGGTRLGPCRDWLASRSRDARFGVRWSVLPARSGVGETIFPASCFFTLVQSPPKDQTTTPTNFLEPALQIYLSSTMSEAKIL
jgi:hypothetical protein